MVDGFMPTVARPPAPTQRRRKLKHAASIAQHVETFRQQQSSDSIRDTLAELAMRLLDPDDRDDFEGVDGPIALVDYLLKTTEEQATLNFMWQSSTIFGNVWQAFEVQESLLLALVTLCHGALEDSIALTFVRLGAARILWDVHATLPLEMAAEFQPLTLGTLRNLAFCPPIPGTMPLEVLKESWRLVSDAHAETEMRVIAAELLTNVVHHDVTAINATEVEIGLLLELFFDTNVDVTLRLSVIDLLGNLCCDPAICLLVIYALDERKPKYRYRHHSGAVYFLDLTDAERHAALRTIPDLLNTIKFCGDLKGMPRTVLESIQESPRRLSKQPGPVAQLGAVRAAALAARQARQLRLKSQQGQFGVPANHDQVRDASPVRRSPGPFHEKKHVHLHLNLDGLKPPPTPTFLSTSEAGETIGSPSDGWSVDMAASPGSWEAPWDADDGNTNDVVEQEVTRRRSSTSQTRRASSSTRRAHPPRRQSSITMSLGSLEGAEFREVANDGPAQLGEHTKRVKRLGKGAGGTVYLSLYLPALKLVAVKEVVVFKEEERQMVKHELHALHENLVPLDASTATTQRTGGLWEGMRHHLGTIGKPSTDSCPYLVGFHGAYLRPAKHAVAIVMEFMDMGSLQDLLDAKITIPELVLRHCAFCCMTALEHMHRHRMIHRDIKPANILMNRNGEFKIADFGLAGTLSKSESFFSEFEGTVMYMAPERIQGHPYSYVSDLWSMGVALFYLATGAYPFAVDDGFFGLEEAIVHDPMPPMPNRFSAECRDFVKALLRRNPNDRMPAAQAEILRRNSTLVA
ncbi:hypothetical protein ATCC90586_010170 [Pythium insidiosum]|nr:hypothetical protein ATCC90586_010170 [Pythium insidiosum]